MILSRFSAILDKEKNILIFLFLVSVLIRIPIAIIYGDTGLEYEWKTLVENLTTYKQLGWKNCEFAYFSTSVCLKEGFILPNLWMPPLYAYYLYFFTFFNLGDQNYIILILTLQILLTSISVPIFYKINKFFFSNRISLLGSLIFSLFPLYVYASSQVSSIAIQSFLTILFLYFFFQIIKKGNFLSILFFSFSAGLLILLRGEFYSILILSLFYLFFLRIGIKKILLIVLITSITISPYVIRNIITFDKFVMMKSFGYNLWKGNHPYAMENSFVVGSEILDANLKKKLDAVPRDKFLRFNFDKIFLEEMIKNVKKNPMDHLFLLLTKAASFMFIDFRSQDPNYYNPLHYLPVLFLGISSLIGMAYSNKKSSKLNYLILIFFAYVFIFSLVSILPRYKLIILPIQIIFTNVFFERIVKKIQFNKNNNL